MLGETVQPMPERSALVSVLEQVAFHPLSIKLVVEQLRLRRVAAVGQALERLLAAVPEGQSKDRCLIASLNLSLERLGMEERELVKRLGVFQGGAMESEVLAITELTMESWEPLRQHLQRVGLLLIKWFPQFRVPYFRFHPTLCPFLFQKLTLEEQDGLLSRYRKQYLGIAGYLYRMDQNKPELARMMALQELPNLLFAVRDSLQSGEKWSAIFVEMVNQFLGYFAMRSEHTELTQKASEVFREIGSPAWFLVQKNLGVECLVAGDPESALEIFEQLLVATKELDPYSRAFVLKEIGSCHQEMGQPKPAYDKYEASLWVYETFDTHPSIQLQISLILENQGNCSLILGDSAKAKSLYTKAKSIADAMGNNVQKNSLTIRMGMAVRAENNFAEAEKLFQAAIHGSRLLNDAVEEAIGWDELGITYQMTQEWEQAEFAYRQSSAIKELKGIIHGPRGIIPTWNNLALVLQTTGKLREAEAWYQKVIDADHKAGGNSVNSASYFSNLANCLQLQGKLRLSEAQNFAQKALLIAKRVDPIAVKIWVLYGILADIAIQQGESAKAQDYRQQSRRSYTSFMGSRYDLKRFENLIQGITLAIADAEVHQQLEEMLSKFPASLATAIRRILAGERDEDEVCLDLDYRSALIVGEVLKRIEKLELRS